jgi:hypothetical protein
VRFYNIIGCYYYIKEGVAILLNLQYLIYIRITAKEYIIIYTYKQTHIKVKNPLLLKPKAF